MSEEEKSTELCNLCNRILGDEGSFDDVQEWLDNHKDNEGLLIKAANYRDVFNFTPLHYLVWAEPPSELVK